MSDWRASGRRSPASSCASPVFEHQPRLWSVLNVSISSVAARSVANRSSGFTSQIDSFRKCETAAHIAFLLEGPVLSHHFSISLSIEKGISCRENRGIYSAGPVTPPLCAGLVFALLSTPRRRAGRAMFPCAWSAPCILTLASPCRRCTPHTGRDGLTEGLRWSPPERREDPARADHSPLISRSSAAESRSRLRASAKFLDRVLKN